MMIKEGLQILNKAPPDPVKASSSFVFISFLFVVAINVRGLGTLWAVFMVALAGMILLVDRKRLMPFLRSNPVLVALPIFSVFSCAWSDQRFVSLSLGLQSLLTVLTGIAMARRMTSRQFLLAVFFAVGVVCLVSIASGNMGPSATGPVLIGVLGSKDGMGLLAYNGAMVSLAILFDREQRNMHRFLAVILFCMESWISVTVHAATATIALVLGVLSFLVIFSIIAHSRAARGGLYFLVCSLLLVGAVFYAPIGEFFQNTVLHGLGKDPTLTGRTILWEKAVDLFLDSPILGHGYRAFWVGNSPAARMLLWQQGVVDGRGFFFHQQYLEVLADTGIVGGFLLFWTSVVFIKRAWKSMVIVPSAFTVYASTILIVLVGRWFLETDFVPFSFDMMMLFSLGTTFMKKSPKDCVGSNGDSLTQATKQRKVGAFS